MSMNSLPEIQRICAAMENEEIGRASFLECLCRLVAAEIGCSRVGIWVFRESSSGRILHCLALYDQSKNCMTSVPDVSGEEVVAYFQTLERVGYVMATDARIHFATEGMFAAHLAPNGVHSMMASAFSVNGKLYGAFTCTQVGRQMEWERRQLNALRQIGSRASLALASQAERLVVNTKPAALT
jgi:GAF domain-containing protein